MTDFLLFCLSASLAIIGIHIAICWPGMLFYDLKNAFEFKLLTTTHGKYPLLINWLRKPLYQCPICMASVWTTLFWTMFINTYYLNVLLAIPIVAGINTFLCILLQNHTDYGCNG